MKTNNALPDESALLVWDLPKLADTGPPIGEGGGLLAGNAGDGYASSSTAA